MPGIEPRFYDYPSRNVTTLLTAVPRIFTTAKEVNKKCDIHMILLVHVCVIQLVLTAYAPQLSVLVRAREFRITIVTETAAWWSYSAGGTRMNCTK